MRDFQSLSRFKEFISFEIIKTNDTLLPFWITFGKSLGKSRDLVSKNKYEKKNKKRQKKHTTGENPLAVFWKLKKSAPTFKKNALILSRLFTCLFILCFWRNVYRSTLIPWNSPCPEKCLVARLNLINSLLNMDRNMNIGIIINSWKLYYIFIS